MPNPKLFDLLADVGGTHARLALSDGPNGEPTNTQVFECRNYSGLQELMHDYLQAQGHPRIRRAALAVATAVTDDLVALTNNSWSLSQRALQAEFQLNTLLVLNDFTALAMSLPSVGPHDAIAIGRATAEPTEAVALIGAGTGLGMSGLLPDGHGGWIPISGEGGHATVAPNDTLETAIVAYLQRYFGHVSTERVLSGQGLVNLYNAVCYVNGRTPARCSPRTLSGWGWQKRIHPAIRRWTASVPSWVVRPATGRCLWGPGVGSISEVVSPQG